MYKTLLVPVDARARSARSVEIACRVAAAFRKAGPQAEAGFRKVLLGIIAAEEDRRRFDPPRQ